jgi:hypothetical protein
MSQPAFVPERREIWWSDGTSGFYALRVDQSVWPKNAGAVRGVCESRGRFEVAVGVPRGAKVRSVHATLAGKRVRVVRRGDALYAKVNLRRFRSGAVRLVVRVRLRGGRTLTKSRVFRPCAQSR